MTLGFVGIGIDKHWYDEDEIRYETPYDMFSNMPNINDHNKYYSIDHGINSRLSEIQASILSLKLNNLARSIRRRRQIAQKYFIGLKDTSIGLPKVNVSNFHVFHIFEVTHIKRDLIIKKIFLNLLEKEFKNGLDKKIYENAKNEFILKTKNINWKEYYRSNPFKESGLALYKWSPIADELKVLDKEIVLNSIMLKWNLVENEFKDLTKNLSFN